MSNFKEPSFKDLLSKSLQDDLKQMVKTPKKSADTSFDGMGKPTSDTLPSARQVANEVKRFNHDAVDEDKVLFMQAMSGVVPLKTDAQVSHNKPLKADENALRRRAAAEGGEDIGGVLSDMQALLNPVAGEAYLSYKHPTLQNKVFEQLKQGKLRWYDAVDLHGSSIEDARHAVQLLIHQAISQGETVVKIVHGKGKDAIIKTCVNGWLRQIADVMAFVSAPANDGGNGAVLVLLKRKKSS
ncbi:Smr/MutS family protein [Moraxella marmotae]|uniref:Smr/MutS family protein n=1 Tax=Moraxella marmotae TaxID=3344520 RepID=UPI0035F48F18